MVQAGKTSKHMLQQFSWTSFLISYAVLSAIWYIGLLLTVYRKAAMAFFSVSISTAKTVSPAAPEPSENQTDAAPQEIMGKSKMPEGLEVSG
jgi:cytoskeletal protein RodZ